MWITTMVSASSSPRRPWRTLPRISTFAAGAPRKNEMPCILEMAAPVVAKGEIRRAYDKNRTPIEDPNMALNGSMAPSTHRRSQRLGNRNINL
ncbi:hypothetical protein GGR53DRAFT_501499, partial [Hypoxylon sp. FL1150]